MPHASDSDIAFSAGDWSRLVTSAVVMSSDDALSGSVCKCDFNTNKSCLWCVSQIVEKTTRGALHFMLRYLYCETVNELQHSEQTQ